MKTPNFVQLKRLGKLPVNAYHVFYEDVKYPFGYHFTRTLPFPKIRETTQTGYFGSLTDMPNYLAVTSGQRNALVSRVVAKLLLDAKDQKVNLWQAYAERAQTMHLIAQTAIRLAGSFAALKKGNLFDAMKKLGVTVSKRDSKRYKSDFANNPHQAIGNAWLERQYGWKPLLNDVYGLAEQFGQYASREVVSKAQSRRTARFEESSKTFNAATGRTITTTKRTKLTIKYGAEFSTSSALHSVAQLGLTNPALIAWELTPFSFVVDWFLPVGNYVSSLDATLGLDFQKGFATTYEESVVDTEISYKLSSLNNGVVMETIGYRRMSKKSVDLVRTKLTTWPSPKLPHFKNPLGVEHVLNALALLTNTFKLPRRLK